MKPERMFHVKHSDARMPTLAQLGENDARRGAQRPRVLRCRIRCASGAFSDPCLTNLRHSGICYPKLTYRRIRHPRRRCPREAAWKQSSRNYRLAKRSNASWCTTAPPRSRRSNPRTCSPAAAPLPAPNPADNFYVRYAVGWYAPVSDSSHGLPLPQNPAPNTARSPAHDDDLFQTVGGRYHYRIFPPIFMGKFLDVLSAVSASFVKTT